MLADRQNELADRIAVDADKACGTPHGASFHQRSKNGKLFFRRRNAGSMKRPVTEGDRNLARIQH